MNTTTFSHKEKNYQNYSKKFISSFTYLYILVFTYYLGFKVNEGIDKIMGLAPYGKPDFQKVN